MSSSPRRHKDNTLESGLALQVLAGLRQKVYRLFATAFLYPDTGWMETLALLATSLARESRPLARFAFWPHCDLLLAALGKLGDTDRPALEASYVRNFMGAVEASMPSAYESAYVERDAMAWLLAELDREYTTAGLSLAGGFPEPADHVAVELEFMSILCGQEARAWRREALDEAVGRLEREARFLQRHLGRWFPEFTRRVGRDNTVYALAAEAAWAFVSHDQDLLTELLARWKKPVIGRGERFVVGQARG